MVGSTQTLMWPIAYIDLKKNIDDYNNKFFISQASYISGCYILSKCACDQGPFINMDWI